MAFDGLHTVVASNPTIVLESEPQHQIDQPERTTNRGVGGEAITSLLLAGAKRRFRFAHQAGDRRLELRWTLARPSPWDPAAQVSVAQRPGARLCCRRARAPLDVVSNRGGRELPSPAGPFSGQPRARAFERITRRRADGWRAARAIRMTVEEDDVLEVTSTLQVSASQPAPAL
jgi:hypothetical protein